MKKESFTMKMMILIAVMISVGNAEARSFKISDVLSAHLLEGGGAVGNGGGTVVCRNADQSIKSVELLDFYEASMLRKMKIDLDQIPGDYLTKAQAVIDRLGAQSQLRQKIYSSWLKTFALNQMILTGVEFNNIPDAMNIGVPKGCKFEQAAVQIIPRFTGDSRYYLNGELFSAMDETQKAGLILHEIVYREALSYGHTDSVATRYFVGLISTPGIASMSSGSFMEMLNQVRFEQTDVSVGDEIPELAHVKIKFNPRKWWRMSQMEENNLLFPVELEGRMVINVGFCNGVGCADWKTYEHAGVMQLPGHVRHQVCSGLEEIYFPGMNDPVRLSQIGARTDEHCKFPVTFNFDFSTPNFRSITFTGDHLNDELFIPDSEPIYIKIDNSARLSGTSMSIGENNGMFSLNNFSSYSFYTPKLKVGSIYDVLEPRIEKPCMFNVDLENGKVIALNPVLYIPQSSTHNCSTLVDVTFNNWKFRTRVNDQGISFDQNENYSAGAKFIAIFPPSNNISPAWKCETSDFNCIDLLKVYGPISLVVSNNVGRFAAPYFSRQSDSNSATFDLEMCDVANGSYEVYPMSMMPKTITLRSDCTMIAKLATKPSVFKAGSVLTLDIDGYVSDQYLK